jgi:hypothetical protein
MDFVAREEARVFDSAFDAACEIEAFRKLLPVGVDFELEDDAGDPPGPLT